MMTLIITLDLHKDGRFLKHVLWRWGWHAVRGARGEIKKESG
jgi:hypothetical protein